MRTLLSLLLVLLTLITSSTPNAYAQSQIHEPIPDYSQLFDAVFGQVQAASSVESDLPIAHTLIEPYTNLVFGGYKFLEDWDPHDEYPHGTVLHPGLDYNLGGGAADAHQPVIAPGTGKIVYAGWLSNTWGGVVAQQIRLRGGEQIWVFAAHLGIDGEVPAGIGADVVPHDDISVARHQIVNQGDLLGLLARGNSAGQLHEVAWNSHLHWEIRHIDHNSYNVGLWPGHNQPIASYLSQVVHPAKFIQAYNSPHVRLYEGAYLAHDAYDAIERPMESVADDPRQQTPAYGVGLYNLPEDFNARSMVVPDGYFVVLYSEIDGNGTPRSFGNPVMDFQQIGELNRSDSSGSVDTLGFLPRSIRVYELPMTPLDPEATATPAPTLTATSTLVPTLVPTLTPKPTLAPTNTPTLAPTNTPTPTSTNTPTPTPTSTPTLAPTSMPTLAPTSMPTSSATSTNTALPTNTPTSTSTLLPTYTATPTTISVTPTPRATLLPTATATKNTTPTSTVLPMNSSTPTPTPTLTPTLTMTPPLALAPTRTPAPTVTTTSTPAGDSGDRNGEFSDTGNQPPDLHSGDLPQDNLDGGTVLLPPCTNGGTSCLPLPSAHTQIFLPVTIELR